MSWMDGWRRLFYKAGHEMSVQTHVVHERCQTVSPSLISESCVDDPVETVSKREDEAHAGEDQGEHPEWYTRHRRGDQDAAPPEAPEYMGEGGAN